MKYTDASVFDITRLLTLRPIADGTVTIDNCCYRQLKYLPREVLGAKLRRMYNAVGIGSQHGEGGGSIIK